MPTPSVRVLVFVSLCSSLAAGCSRPGEKRCTEVCEHYLELYLADQWQDKLAKAASAEERAQLERARTDERAALRTDQERGFETCVARCNRRSRGEVADCVMNATTLDEAKACDGDDDSGCRASPTPRDRAPLGTALLALAGLALLAFTRRRARPLTRPRT